MLCYFCVVFCDLGFPVGVSMSVLVYILFVPGIYAVKVRVDPDMYTDNFL